MAGPLLRSADAPGDTSASDLRTAFTRLADAVRWPDGVAGAAAREHRTVNDGRVGDLLEWLAAAQGSWPPRPFRRARLLVPGRCAPSVAALADRRGVGVREITLPGDVAAAFAAGSAAADAEIEAGADMLAIAGHGRPSALPDTDTGGGAGSADAAAAVLVGLLTGAEPIALLPRGAAAVDTARWIARAQHLRDARRTTAGLRGQPAELLVRAGSTAVAACVGAVLQAAARCTPVVVDGTPAVAAALLCVDHQRRVTRWVRVADTSANPVHTRALAELYVAPVLDLGTGRGDGAACLLALGVLDAATVLAGHGPAAQASAHGAAS